MGGEADVDAQQNLESRALLSSFLALTLFRSGVGVRDFDGAIINKRNTARLRDAVTSALRIAFTYFFLMGLS